MKRIKVDMCIECPLNELVGPTWFCTVSSDDTHHMRIITDAVRRPPRWCPLRRQDHIVTLRKP